MSGTQNTMTGRAAGTTVPDSAPARAGRQEGGEMSTKIEVNERREMVRFVLSDGREVTAQVKQDARYGTVLEIVKGLGCDGCAAVLPIIGSNGVAVQL